MKYLSKIMLLAAAVCCLNSCDDLDEFPQDEMSPESFFSSETECELYTNQFYSLMPSVSSNFNWYLEEGEHIVVPAMSREILGARIIPTNASEVGWTWTQLRKINYFLQNAYRCEDKSVRNHYKGVAYFFRAYFYHTMMMKFGELPWYDEPIESDETEYIQKAQDSREVIMQHIIADCDSAIAMLPQAHSAYTVNSWTAVALKARACLFEGTFRKYHAGTVFNPESLPWEDLLKQGAAAAKEIFTNGGYQLFNTGDEPYRDLFATLEAREDEVIWSRRCSETVAIKCNANGWANTRAVGFTKQFVNLYLNADGSRFTDKDGYQTMSFVEECTDRDPRMFQTVYCPGYIQKGETKTYKTDLTMCPTGYKFIKYVMEAKYNTWDASLVALPIFRLAEMYLIYAESLAELGTITQNDLDISINKLRDRAGMPHLSLAEANANPDPYLLSAETGHPNVTKSQNTGVILEIRRERMIELALEGLHWNDIIRWREGKIYERPFYGMYFPGEGKYDITGDGKADIAIYTDKKPSGLGLTYLKIGENITLSNGTSGYLVVHGDEALQRTWNENRDYLYAIPINERLLSGMALKQNPGWSDGLD